MIQNVNDQEARSFSNLQWQLYASYVRLCKQSFCVNNRVLMKSGCDVTGKNRLQGNLSYGFFIIRLKGQESMKFFKKMNQFLGYIKISFFKISFSVFCVVEVKKAVKMTGYAGRERNNYVLRNT